jgi:hypothetical protein
LKAAQIDTAVTLSLADAQNWTWGLSLIFLTVMIHAVGLVLMAIVGVRVRLWLAPRGLGLRVLAPIVIGLVGGVGLLLALLHGIEAVIWAAAYMWVGALDSLADAMLYSFDSMTTRGASGLTLERRWQMMGALEAGDGMLLFGISTAYVFALLQTWWPMLKSHRH